MEAIEAAIACQDSSRSKAVRPAFFRRRLAQLGIPKNRGKS